jgi:UDP-N-acetylglucosamine:LPS N-acetylglucosamine transferase
MHLLRSGAVRILIVTASIGAGHDLPAKLLADDLAARGADVAIADGLAALGRLRHVAGEDASRAVFFGHQWVYDAVFAASVRLPPARAVLRAALGPAGAPGLSRLVARHRPDAVVSTYPVTTEVVGWMRRHGRLGVPGVAVVTDLASLRFWAAPGMDLHLVTHPESVDEVRRIAGPCADVRVVRGLVAPAFYAARDRREARRSLGLPAAGRLVVVSGGGWGVGDLQGALEVALGLPGVDLGACLCGSNDALRRRLTQLYRGRPGIVVEGFTDRMGDWLAAADALVHSTAGLTVLEAVMRGCPVVSYGWGRGHIRINDDAFRHFGLAEVATSRTQLRDVLARVLATPRGPAPALDGLVEAADAVLDLAG